MQSWRTRLLADHPLVALSAGADTVMANLRPVDDEMSQLSSDHRGEVEDRSLQFGPYFQAPIRLCSVIHSRLRVQ